MDLRPSADIAGLFSYRYCDTISRRLRGAGPAGRRHPISMIGRPRDPLWGTSSRVRVWCGQVSAFPDPPHGILALWAGNLTGTIGWAVREVWSRSPRAIQKAGFGLAASIKGIGKPAADLMASIFRQQ